MDQIELEWGVKFLEGRNSEISFMAHVWEDLRVLPKPLALHLVCELVSALAVALLWQMGFRMDTCQVRAQPLLARCMGRQYSCSALLVQLGSCVGCPALHWVAAQGKYTDVCKGAAVCCNPLYCNCSLDDTVPMQTI